MAFEIPFPIPPLQLATGCAAVAPHSTRNLRLVQSLVLTVERAYCSSEMSRWYLMSGGNLLEENSEHLGAPRRAGLPIIEMLALSCLGSDAFALRVRY
jgi:hypothetical protein